MMDGYSQAIYALDSTPRSNSHRAEVTSLAVWLLPNFRAVVFAVTLFQVLLLSQGSQTLFRDSDTGWHVRNGETILNTHALPRTDRFSYTREGQPWFAWEWLSDAVFGSAYRLAGLPGVAVLSALAIALTALGVAHLALSLGGNLFFTAGAIVVLLGTTSIHWLARPHIFSWILALLFLGVAEHERHGHGQPSRILYALPFVAILWANLHGSFLLGPAILFIYAAGEWLDRRSGKRFAAASLASLLATFINPYGWQLHDHVFSYLQNDYLMDHISEFRSFSFHSPGSLYVELFLLVAVAGTLALLRQRAFGPAILGLAMLHISLYSARHLPTAAPSRSRRLRSACPTAGRATAIRRVKSTREDALYTTIARRTALYYPPRSSAASRPLRGLSGSGSIPKCFRFVRRVSSRMQKDASLQKTNGVAISSIVLPDGQKFLSTDAVIFMARICSKAMRRSTK